MQKLAEYLIHNFNQKLDYGDLDWDFRTTYSANYVSYGIREKPIIYSIEWTKSTLHIGLTMKEDLFEAMTKLGFVGKLNEGRWATFKFNGSQQLDDFRKIVQTQIDKYK